MFVNGSIELVDDDENSVLNVQKCLEKKNKYAFTKAIRKKQAFCKRILFL